MKKPRVSILVIITLLFAAFLLGFLFGRSQSGDVIVTVPKDMQTTPHMTEPIVLPTAAETEPVSFPININTANQEMLMHLPGIGEVLAKRILSYREVAGDFQHVTDLMNIEGIGKKKMEELLNYVTTGGSE